MTKKIRHNFEFDRGESSKAEGLVEDNGFVSGDFSVYMRVVHKDGSVEMKKVNILKDE